MMKNAHIFVASLILICLTFGGAQVYAQTPPDLPAPDDVAAPPEDAEKTPSGLTHKLIKAGKGTEHPGPADLVTVHYSGWTTDGKLFDSSIPRIRPATLPLNGVIAGWTEGLQLMVKGEKRRFWIPENLAYQGRPDAPAGMLVFDIHLLDYEPAPKPHDTPPDVDAPSRGAVREESGLASKVIRPGVGRIKPEATSKVVVHYTGWTTDGKMFDSSKRRGKPSTFTLNQVIPGWTEGLQLMVVGETRRFWIPEDLAYQGRSGAPAGMLVFDVELIDILD
ncbi:MAG: peptidylprolyl isomerase [bacterium]|nr:peptidylprolyl isomerase [bacterium]